MNQLPAIRQPFRVEPVDYHADFKDLRAIREPVFVQEQQRAARGWSGTRSTRSAAT